MLKQILIILTFLFFFTFSSKIDKKCFEVKNNFQINSNELQITGEGNMCDCYNDDNESSL